ncbi:MAG: outer membrane beta-barrel protein, partial [Verrucomicrobiales bacterium]|nr:outer membrane beta-barrel protein [Verrucomicrobiales bacterium]
QGSNSDWENRRVRLGAKIGFLDQFVFQTSWNLKRNFGSSGDLFDDIDTMFITWEATDDLYVKVGKQKPGITQEYGTSSKRLLTFERSNIVNTVIPDKLWGVVAGYNLTDRLTQEAGIYTGGFEGDVNLPEFNAGVAAMSRTSYELNDVTTIRFDYFYADQDPASNAVEAYEHIFSLGSHNKFDGWGFYTDLIGAKGTDDANHDDVFGVVLLPYYDLTDKLQLVGRYTYMTSDSDTGVRLQSRYERRGGAAPVNTRGEDYHSIYAGFNYRICGDKLKLMGGVEYANLDGASNADWDGWSYLVGVRTYW